jgi:hypothetical protein
MQVNRPPLCFVATGMGTRVVVAVAVLVSAAVHLWLWIDGFRDVDMIGPAFLLNAVGGAVIAVAVLVWRHWLPLLAAVGFGLSTLGAFLISATVGLFGFHEQFLGTWQLVAAVSEIVAVVGGLMLLWRVWSMRQTPSRRQAVRT